MEKELPLAKLTDFHSLTVKKALHNAYEQNKPDLSSLMVSPQALIGIELEVENIKNYPFLEYYWTQKEDGSLRNYGAEFTSIPLRGYQIPLALQYLSKQLYESNTPDFSTRTSVHIHLNVRDMPIKQIKVLILLYALFERHFFNIAGTKRETSVFCVPLYRTTQLYGLLSKDLFAMSHYWHKYSAINCGTIYGNDDVPKFGTIEFRHLYGTLEQHVILNWINSIMLLREASHKIRLEELVEQIKTMNTTSAYAALYKDIFKDKALMQQMTKKDFEYCVTTTKLALFEKELPERYYEVLPNSNFSKRHKPKNTYVNKFKINTPINTVDEVTAFLNNLHTDQLTPA